jgi:hypothetical protein
MVLGFLQLLIASLYLFEFAESKGLDAQEGFWYARFAYRSMTAIPALNLVGTVLVLIAAYRQPERRKTLYRAGATMLFTSATILCLGLCILASSPVFFSNGPPTVPAPVGQICRVSTEDIPEMLTAFFLATPVLILFAARLICFGSVWNRADPAPQQSPF